jgi:hypothetical protein
MRWLLLALLALGTNPLLAASDPQKLADQIDAIIDARLKAEQVPATRPASDAEFVRRAHDANGDLAAIGDEQGLDLAVVAHGCKIIRGAALWYGSFRSYDLP